MDMVGAGVGRVVVVKFVVVVVVFEVLLLFGVEGSKLIVVLVSLLEGVVAVLVGITASVGETLGMSSAMIVVARRVGAFVVLLLSSDNKSISVSSVSSLSEVMHSPVQVRPVQLS